MVKKINKKYFLLLAFLVVFLSLDSSFARALEVPLPGLGTNPDLTAYIVYFFKFGISIAGVIALISFTIGAVGLIISADNAEAASNAKDRMKGAILGLVLTIACWIIINTINPVILTPNLNPLPPAPGVYYTNGNQTLQCPVSEPDTSTIPKGFNSIIYTCSDNNGPALLVWQYPNKNFQGNNGTTNGINVDRLDCNGEPLGIKGSSFITTIESPGVYFCLGGCAGNMCSGYMSDVNTTDLENVGNFFSGQIKGVRIVNDPTNGIYYGVIFHKTPDLTKGGYCSTPIIDTSNSSVCEPVTDFADTYAANIFLLNKTTPTTTPISSGQGVSFYSDDFGLDNGARAGHYDVSASTIASAITSGNSYYQLQASTMCFSYQGVVDREDAYKYKCTGSTCGSPNKSCRGPQDCNTANGETCGQIDVDTGIGTCVDQNGNTHCSANACEDFQDCSYDWCPGSINIKGSYLVALYSQDTTNNNANYCDTFITDVHQLSAQSFLPSGANNKLNSVYIIPITQ